MLFIFYVFFLFCLSRSVDIVTPMAAIITKIIVNILRVRILSTVSVRGDNYLQVARKCKTIASLLSGELCCACRSSSARARGLIAYAMSVNWISSVGNYFNFWRIRGCTVITTVTEHAVVRNAVSVVRNIRRDVRAKVLFLWRFGVNGTVSTVTIIGSGNLRV